MSHAQTDHDLVPFRCTYESCPYYTFNKDNIRKHINDSRIIHKPKQTKAKPTKAKVYSCKSCSLQFPNKEEYQNHRINIHGEEDRLQASLHAKCRLCNQQFANKPALAVHRKRPHRLECSQCDLKFVLKHDLRRHAYNEHGEANEYSEANICGLCHRQFAQKCDIYRHQRKLHKWDCASCELKFVQQKDMWQHVQDEHDATKYV